MRKRKQNPKGKHLPGATAAQQRQYEAIKKSLVKRGSPLAEAKRIAAATVRSRQNPLSSEAEKLARELGLSSGEMSLLSAKSPAFQMKFLRKMKADKAAVEKKESKATTPAQKASAEKSKRSFLSRLGTRLRVIGQSQKFKVSARDLGRCKHKIVKVRGRHETDALSKARSQLGSGFDDLKVVNPFRRIKNAGKYIDIVIRGQAKKTPEGWKLGKKTFPQGRGTTKVSSGYYLDRNTGLVYGKRERNRVGRRNESVSMGFWEGGVFHPIRASDDYDPEAVGERYQYAPKKRKSRKKKVAKPAKKRGNPRRKGLHGAYAKLHKMGVRRKSYIATSRRQIRKATKRNPSPAEIRREFAGRYDKDSRLFFPDGTPHGLAKLGKLLAIKTTAGTIRPHSKAGDVWLCSDTRKRLHLGSTVKAPLFDGPTGDLGEVKEIEYQESKPHLGYGKTNWFHVMAENGGRRPTLHANRKGELRFRGGTYTLEKEGITG